MLTLWVSQHATVSRKVGLRSNTLAGECIRLVRCTGRVGVGSLRVSKNEFQLSQKEFQLSQSLWRGGRATRMQSQASIEGPKTRCVTDALIVFFRSRSILKQS